MFSSCACGEDSSFSFDVSLDSDEVLLSLPVCSTKGRTGISSMGCRVFVGGVVFFRVGEEAGDNKGIGTFGFDLGGDRCWVVGAVIRSVVL